MLDKSRPRENQADSVLGATARPHVALPEIDQHITLIGHGIARLLNLIVHEGFGATRLPRRDYNYLVMHEIFFVSFVAIARSRYEIRASCRTGIEASPGRTVARNTSRLRAAYGQLSQLESSVLRQPVSQCPVGAGAPLADASPQPFSPPPPPWRPGLRPSSWQRLHHAPPSPTAVGVVRRLLAAQLVVRFGSACHRSGRFLCPSIRIHPTEGWHDNECTDRRPHIGHRKATS